MNGICFRQGMKGVIPAVAKRTFSRAPNCLQELPGRLWEGKESLLYALGAVCTNCVAALGQQAGMVDSVLSALIDASKKKKTAYRTAAWAQLSAGEDGEAERVGGWWMGWGACLPAVHATG